MSGMVLRVWWTVLCQTALWLWILGLLTSFAVESLSSPWASATSGAVLGLVTVVAGVRTLRSSLRVDERGITIRNTWRTRSWTWDKLGEVGWDAPGWSRGGLAAISVCALGDPYTHTASATATGGRLFERLAGQLGPHLDAHGVTNRILDEIAVRHRWWADPRSRELTNP
jgi:hypothetical protein